MTSDSKQPQAQEAVAWAEVDGPRIVNLSRKRDDFSPYSWRPLAFADTAAPPQGGQPAQGDAVAWRLVRPGVKGKWIDGSPPADADEHAADHLHGYPGQTVERAYAPSSVADAAGAHARDLLALIEKFFIQPQEFKRATSLAWLKSVADQPQGRPK